MTHRRIAYLLTVLLAAVSAVFALPTYANAHTASRWYTEGKWPRNATIRYGVHIGFPGNTYRFRLLDGIRQWNDAASSGEPTIAWTLPDDVNHGQPTEPCGLATNTGAVFWTEVINNELGRTRKCWGGGRIYTFTIEFDRSGPWYNGTGDALPGETDFWSVATHEFGHALGFVGHFDDDPNEDRCGNVGSRLTMCKGVFSGTERQRTLDAHDIHTFDAAYT